MITATLVLATLVGQVNPVMVDDAIDKGARWLLAQDHGKSFTWNGHTVRNHELVLYTLKHAGVDLNQPKCQALFEQMLKDDLTSTYLTSLQAMILQELDAAKYQWRIAQCGQFLVDNQCENGQWGYGRPTTLSGDIPTTGTKKNGRSTRPRRSIKIKAQRTGPATGDNSNSQYAALGLRACLDARVQPPTRTLVRAVTHWENTQNEDGGWGYREDSSFGSMTTGAVASLIIYRDYLRRDWKRNPSVVAGVGWMARNFTVEDNPKRDSWWQFYYLYALERVGMLGGLKKIGPHDWYEVGAASLLKNQKSDGTWTNKTKYTGGNRTVWDTCFAILFLKRATAPVPSVDRGARK